MSEEFVLGPFEVRGRQEGDPPSDWLKPILPILRAILRAETDELATEMLERQVALAIVTDKDVVKALRKVKEQPILDVLRRRQQWHRNERLGPGHIFSHMYPRCDWFEASLREAYRAGLNGKTPVLKHLWQRDS